MEKRFLSFFKASIGQLALLFIACISFSSCILNIDDIFNKADDLVDDYNSDPTAVNDFPTDNKADVIFICYMDGDNNLDGPIWKDLNEIEYGLYKAEKNSNSKKAKVDVIVLWDGVENDNGSSHSKTSLYKIGPDERFANRMPYPGLSNKTLDLSKTASFIFNTSNGKKEQEVSMSNPKTLENLLIWVKEHYIIDNNTKIILHFADHGGGPRSIVDSRAMCQDENIIGYSQPLLYTKDVPIAIKNSGIGKIDLVIQDVCNGASIEEAYEYKDVADYMLVSPNEMPGSGLNYDNIVSHLSEGDCIHNGSLDVEEFLGKAVSEFINFYKRSEDYWNQRESEIKELLRRKNNNLPIENKVDESKITPLIPLIVSLSDINVPTITALKLADIKKLQERVKNLATELNSSLNKFTIMDDKNVKQEFNYLNALQNFVFLNMDYYLGNELGDLPQYYRLTESEKVKGFKFNYATTFANLYDLGIFCDFVKEFNKINIDGKAIISKYADDVINSLKSVILYSWRDGYKGALYNKSNTTLNPIWNADNQPYYYGFTISGPAFTYSKTGPVSIRFPVIPAGFETDINFYTKELLFGKDTPIWNQLMINMMESNKVRYSESQGQ